MKKISGFVSLALLATSLVTAAWGQAAKAEVLTNDDIIAMQQAGLSPTVIVNKIRSSKTQFDLTAKELIRLRQSGIPDDVLQAMQGYSESASVAQMPVNKERERQVEDADDPLASHEVGIYVYAERSGARKLTELEANVATQTRTAGTLGNAVSYGIWPTKVKERIAGTSSNYIVTEAQPAFYFYLNQKDRTMQAVRYFPSSVNQFQLVRFNVKGKTREVTVSKTNLLGGKSGMYDSSVIEFAFEKVGEGVFKVTPKQPLRNGEYGFYLLGTGTSVGATFYDFSVRMVP